MKDVNESGKYSYKFPRPAVTTDCLVFREYNNCIELLLIKRKKDPFKNYWALPGGFLEMDETPLEGVKRELKEETGLEVSELKEVGAFGGIHRDPRGRTITIAYYTFLKDNNISLNARTDAIELGWFPLEKIPEMAFDHKEIVEEAKLKLKSNVILAKLEMMDFFGLKGKIISKIFNCLN